MNKSIKRKGCCKITMQAQRNRIPSKYPIMLNQCFFNALIPLQFYFWFLGSAMLSNACFKASLTEIPLALAFVERMTRWLAT